MTILYINGIFKLPDDFSGDLQAALKELIKYRSSHRENNPIIERKSGKIPDKTFYDALETFKNGFMFHADVFLGKHDGTDWIEFPILKDEEELFPYENPHMNDKF